jgi:osmotically-inducible protein OsmY
LSVVDQFTPASLNNVNGNVMSKTALKNLLWTGLPVVLLMGCAHTQTQTAPVYSALPTAPARTSDQPAERIYAEGNTTRTAPPSGVAAEDWELNEKLRALFLDNRKLAPPPSEVTAVVDQQNRGVVRVSGHVSNGVQRRQVIDAVSKIPGVTRVEDHLLIGVHKSTGAVDLQAPP